MAILTPLPMMHMKLSCIKSKRVKDYKEKSYVLVFNIMTYVSFVLVLFGYRYGIDNMYKAIPGIRVFPRYVLLFLPFAFLLMTAIIKKNVSLLIYKPIAIVGIICIFVNGFSACYAYNDVIKYINHDSQSVLSNLVCRSIFNLFACVCFNEATDSLFCSPHKNEISAQYQGMAFCVCGAIILFVSLTTFGGKWGWVLFAQLVGTVLYCYKKRTC